MLTKIRFGLAIGALAVVGLLVWRIDVLSTSLAKANREVGTLKQSEAQLIADLNAEQSKVARLQSLYQKEQTSVAKLVEELEREKSLTAERQQRAYDAAQKSSCANEPLPGELIRLRNSRASAPSHQN
ncbi:hypothetical protein ACOCGL_003464 [Vibrio cholerae]